MAANEEEEVGQFTISRKKDCETDIWKKKAREKYSSESLRDDELPDQTFLHFRAQNPSIDFFFLIL